MSDNKNYSPEEHLRNEVPSTEERGLQPANNPPPMPEVKPTKSEADANN